MTDSNPFRVKTNDPKRLAARHMAGQYFDLLDDLNNARIDAGLTFDQLAEQLPHSASELRTKLSQSAHELDFLTLHMIANMTGHKYEITLVPYDKKTGTPEKIQAARQDPPDPVIVAHRMPPPGQILNAQERHYRLIDSSSLSKKPKTKPETEMTDQPHTPTATQIREDYAHLRYHFADGWSVGEERVQFDNWLTAELAAAEQRGKEQAWDEGYRDGYNDGLSDGHNLDNMRDPNENPYRTDQMEGDG